MGTLSNKLQDLDAGEFLDVMADVTREHARRSTNKTPAEMNDLEYARWVDEEIRKTAAAKARSKESADGSE